MKPSLARELALLLVVVLTATLLPLTAVDAKVDTTAGSESTSVDVFYDWAVVGNESAQLVNIYRFDGQRWNPWGQVEPPSAAPSFGHTVAIGRADTRQEPLLVVGAPSIDTVFVYRLASGEANLVTAISGSDGSGFGESVDTSASNIVVGAPFDEGGAGAAYFFDQQGAFIDGVLDPNLAFAGLGTIVQMEDTMAWLSAPGLNDNIGGVIQYDLAAGSQLRTITPESPFAGMRFGSSLATDPTRVLIGAGDLGIAWLQVGTAQIEIDSPSNLPIIDVALEGNLVAFAYDGDTQVNPIDVLSDNGDTGLFVPIDQVAGDLLTTHEIVLGGGHLLAAGAIASGGATENFWPTFIDDGDTNKILPPIGRQETNYGSRVDVDGTTMVAARGTSTSLGQILISNFDGFEWMTNQIIDVDTGPIAGGITVDRDTIVASIGDKGNAANPNVAIYTRGATTEPFTLTGGLRTQTGAPPRSVAIDPSGQVLALGLPNSGQVEVYTGGPSGWATDTPQVLAPFDPLGTGAATFGWDLDFGDGFLLIGKPGSPAFNDPVAFPGMAEQWRIDDLGVATYFGYRQSALAEPGDFGGWTVEIDDGLRAIGMPGVGKVQVYRSGLSDSLLVDPAPIVDDRWGYVMDLDAGVLVIGDEFGDTIAYDLHTPNISTLGTFEALDAEANDFSFQTYPVATSDGAVMVGARLEDWQGRDAGAIYTFSVTPSPAPEPASTYLPVVDIDAKYAVVGNPVQDLVHVLRSDGTTWTEFQTLTGVAGTSFGAAVALDGDRLVVGSPDAAGAEGEVTVFARQSDETYAFNRTLTFGGASTIDRYGSTLDIVGDFVIAGAPVTGGIGSAVIFNHRTGATEALVSTGVAGDGLGSDVTISHVGDRADNTYLAWVAAPAANIGNGLVIGYAYDGIAWTQTSTIEGAAGDAYGSAIESNGNRLAANNPNTDATLGKVEVTTWDLTSQAAGTTSVTPVTSSLSGDVAASGDLLAVGSAASGEVHIWSDNGSDLTYLQTILLGNNSLARSFAIDGQWLIDANDTTSTDWTQIATITDLSSLAPQPNLPTNKTLPELATDGGRFGSALAISDNTIVVAAEGSYRGSAISELVVIDRTTDAIIQRLRNDVLTSDAAYRAVDIDGNRLAFVKGESVQIRERVAPGEPFSTTLVSIGANAVADVDLEGDTLVFGIPSQNQVRVFDLVAGSWVEAPDSPLTAANSLPGDELGSSVAVAANVVVAGAPNDQSGLPGNSVVVWARPDGTNTFVEQSHLRNGDSSPGQIDRFGASVAFDGARLVVGAPYQDFNGGGGDGSGSGTRLGAVHVFDHLGGGTFGAVDTLRPDLDSPSGTSTPEWGTDVALSDNMIVAGGPGWTGSADGQGAVIAYQFDAGASTWSSAAFVGDPGVASDGEPLDALGAAVGISGTTIIAGAPNEDMAGHDAGALYTMTLAPITGPPLRVWPTVTDMDNGWAVVGNPSHNTVYVLHNDGAGWAQTQELTGAAGSAFGAGVAIEGDRLYVGSPGATAAAGEVTAFARGLDGTYTQIGAATYSGATTTDTFGSVIDASGNWLIAGAPDVTGPGSAVVFDRDLTTEIGVFTTTDSGTGFGSSVALGHTGPDEIDFAWVGAPNADLSAGAVYGWRFNGTNWVSLNLQQGFNAGDRLGQHLEGGGEWVGITQPGSSTGSVIQQQWRTTGKATIMGPWSTPSVIDGDVDQASALVAAGSVTSGEVYILQSGNGQRSVLGTLSGVSGHSLAIDGDWLIATTGSGGTEWNTLVKLAQISSLGNFAHDAPNKLIPEFGSDYTRYGSLLDSTADTWVIGAPGNLSMGAPNSFEVYDEVDQSLTQRFSQLTVNDPWRDLAVDGNRLAVLDSTSVTVLERSGPGLAYDTETATIAVADGTSLDLDGDLLTVGDPTNNLVHVFDAAAGWAPVSGSPFTAAAVGVDDLLGYSVAVSGDVVAAGAPRQASTNSAGYVAVWSRDGAGLWTEQPSVDAGNTYASIYGRTLDRFGRSIDFDGTWLVVGLPEQLEPDQDTGTGTDNPGLVTVFAHLGGGTFGPLSVINPAETVPGDIGNRTAWGHSVSVANSTIAAGAPGFQLSNNTAYMGAVVAYTYDETESTWSVADFAEGAGIDQNMPGNRDMLGDTVTISANTVITGAPHEHTANRRAGAAYTFVVPPPPPPQEPENKLLSPAGSDLSDGEIGDLFGMAIDSDGTRLVIGAPERASLPAPIGVVGSLEAGGVYVFTRGTAGWDFEQFIENPSGETGSEFGRAVAVDGDRLVVGAPATGNNSLGTAWLFDLSPTSPASPIEILAESVTGSARYGSAVDVEGDLIAIGANQFDFDDAGTPVPASNFGGFFVWEVIGGVPELVHADSGDSPSDQYGTSVVIDSGNIAVGTIGNQAGYVDVWRADGAGGFVTDPRIVGPDQTQFGFAVDLEADRLVIGAPNGETAEVYTYDGSSWSLEAELIPSAADPGDDFGLSVSIDGTVIAVGEPQDDDLAGTNQGRVHVFGNTAFGEWAPIGEHVAPDPADNDFLGRPVKVVDGTVMAGAPFDDNSNGLDAGAVYFFDVVVPEPPIEGKFIAPVGSDLGDGESGDFFGSSFATDGERLVIGAPESDGTGRTGGLHVYTSNGAGGWDFEMHIENPDPDAVNSNFPLDLAVQGDLVVAGSPFTDGGSGPNSGTVWLIDLATSQATRLLDPTPTSSHFFGITIELEGDVLAVGARGTALDGPDPVTFAGELHIYENDGAGTWVPVETRVGSAAQAQYSAGLALSGDRLAVGALGTGDTGYVEVLRRTSPGVWQLEQTFTGSNIDDQFGFGLDLDGNNLAIAAPGVPSVTMYTYHDGLWDDGVVFSDIGEVGNPTGISLDGTIALVAEPFFDDPAKNEGSFTVYANTEWKVWTELTTVHNPDPGRSDFFGGGIVIGDQLVVGSPRDDNSNGTDAGAAYLFAIAPPSPPAPPTKTIISDLDYSLPTTVEPGATSVTVEGASLATTSGSTTSGGGIVAASIGSIDLSPSDGADLPLGDITLADLGIDTTVAGTQTLMLTPLSEFPIEGGWAQYLPAEYSDVPLQTITLGEVWNLSTVQSIPLKFADIQESPLKFADIAAVAFGDLDLLSIDLDGQDSTAPIDEWCAALAAVGTTCAELGITAGSTLTLGTISAAGVNVEATPLKFAPLKFAYIEASPLKFAPLKFADIEASPLKFAPLKFAGIEASPLKFAPLKFAPLKFAPLKFAPLKFAPLKFADINATPLKFAPLKFATNPGNIADCSIVDCTDDTLTLGQVADAGALLDGFTLDDLGDTILGDLRFEDILAGLDQQSIDGLQAILDGDDTITLDTLLAQFGIDGLGDMTLGDLDAAVFELIELTIGEFFAGFDPAELDNYTIADFLLLFLPREAYEWDAVDLGAVNLQLAGMQAPVTASIAFTTADGPPTDDVTLHITLPDGSVVQESTFVLAPTGARIDGVDITETTATVRISNVGSGEPQLLTFGLYQGLDLGTSTSFVDASTDISSMTAIDTITVVEAFEPENDGLAGAVPVLSDNLYISHVGTTGDADFFRLTVTDPSTSVSVQLANLGADYDLVVYGPKLGSIVPASDTEAASAPSAEFDGTGSSTTLSPVPLNDLPTSLDELQIYGASYFRGTDSEQVDFVAIEAADYYVQVTGYLGASSPEAYSLQAVTIPRLETPCPTRTFAYTGAVAGTNTSAAGADTLILVNRSRFEGFYGANETALMQTALDDMVSAAASNGINAAILDLDAFANVNAAYDAWDASPCSTIAVNNVVGAISAELLAIRATQQIDNILIVGGDDIVPFARVSDATTIANEQSYTNTFSADQNNALRSAFAGQWLLTDDPYGDQAATPIANTDRFVYIPDLAMGRLVETPSEIIHALENYVAFDGQLDPQTGFVAGYDFLDDGAQQTGDNLDQVISPGVVQRLINETWTSSELAAGLASTPDTALISAHFDHAYALPAASSAANTTTDLFSVDDVAGLDFSGSILFSVGCHGGLSVSDLLIAPSGVVSQDWAQTFLGTGAAAFVGNTGYGYGDDTAVALSEKLMADFAEGLGDYETIGEALLYAKQNYAADLTVYGAYDEKALMEATLYGIPFYTLGNTIVADPVPDVPTEPAVTGGVAYSDSFDPIIEVAGDGTEDEVWSTPDEDGHPQVQVTNGYPILPRFEFEVTQQDPTNSQQLEREARGVVLESLVTRDEINVDPATARAVFDLAANEPNTDASDVTFALAPAISTYLTPEGVRQDVNMAVGAFQSNGSGTSGTMRLFEQFEATVYYAENPDAESNKPTITSVQANPGQVFNLSVTVSDESPIARVVALVTPTPAPNTPTTWQLLELSEMNGRWQTDATVGSDSIQWLIMAIDIHGNSAWSMSKQLAFDEGSTTGFDPILLNPVAPATPVLVGEDVSLLADLWDYNGTGDPISVTWDFGDGSTCTVGSGGTCELDPPTDTDPMGATSTTHAYSEPGAYDVSVTATDSTGRTDELAVGVVVVVTETIDGSVIANGQSEVGVGTDDILPNGAVDSEIKVNVTAGYESKVVDKFNVRFNIPDVFDFRGDDFDYADVVGDTALVVGSGVLSPDMPDEEPVLYTVFIDQSSGLVTLTVWEDGSDINTTTPRYRITAELSKKQAIKIRS